MYRALGIVSAEDIVRHTGCTDVQKHPKKKGVGKSDCLDTYNIAETLTNLRTAQSNADELHCGRHQTEMTLVQYARGRRVRHRRAGVDRSLNGAEVVGR